MIKWYSQNIEPTKSKNIIVRNNKSVHICGDYSHNKDNELEPLSWKKFKSHMLLTFHSEFEWAYWEDVEKMLLKDLK